MKRSPTRLSSETEGMHKILLFGYRGSHSYPSELVENGKERAAKIPPRQSKPPSLTMQSGNRCSWWHGCDITQTPFPSLQDNIPNKYPEFPSHIRHCFPRSCDVFLTLLLLILATEPPDDVVPGSVDAVVIGAGRGDVGDGGERARPTAVALQRVPVQSSVCGKERSKLRGHN